MYLKDTSPSQICEYPRKFTNGAEERRVTSRSAMCEEWFTERRADKGPATELLTNGLTYASAFPCRCIARLLGSIFCIGRRMWTPAPS
jgi:hypothetical protein